MRVESLDIERPRNGDNAGKLVGSITLKDVFENELKITLTPAAISRLVAAVSSDVIESLRVTAAQAPRALQQAQDEGYLLEQDRNLTLPEN